MTGPIRPDEVAARKAAQIPAKVYEVFNELITRGWNGSYVVIRQEDVVKRLAGSGLAERQIYAEHMLDVEDAYRALGWKVEYDKPAYNESYAATFKFSKPRD
jgi:hypothetical protein